MIKVTDIKKGHYLKQEEERGEGVEPHYMLVRSDKYGNHVEKTHLHKSDFTLKAWKKVTAGTPFSDEE